MLWVVVHTLWNSLPPPRRICFRRCLSVCLSATLRKNFQTDLHEIFREGWQWASEQNIKFWWRSVSPSDGYSDCFGGFVTIGRYGKWLADINRLLILIRQMAAPVRHALAEVCTERHSIDRIPLPCQTEIGTLSLWQTADTSSCIFLHRFSHVDRLLNYACIAGILRTDGHPIEAWYLSFLMWIF